MKIGWPRTKAQANTHLPGSLGNPIAHDAVDADGSQKQSEGGEKCEQQSVGTRLSGIFAHALAQGGHVVNGNRRIDALNFLPQGAKHAFRSVSCANHQVHVDDDFALKQRAVDDRLGFGILAQRVVFDVARDADDLHPRAFGIRWTVLEAFSNRILAWPVAPRERFADEYNSGSRERVLRGEISPPQDRCAHRVKIIGTYLLVVDCVGLCVGDRRMAFDGEPALKAAPKKWIDKRSRRRINPRELRDFLCQLRTEAVSTVRIGISIGHIESQRHGMIGAKTGTVRKQMLQTSQHQPPADHKNERKSNFRNNQKPSGLTAAKAERAFDGFLEGSAYVGSGRTENRQNS